jgi:hypothetical protein
MATLIEPGVKYFLNQTLKQCHIFRENHNNLLFNSSLLATFLIILALILLFKYKGKLTPKELEIKDREKQQYILTKIKNYQTAKLKESQGLITGLPRFD